MQVLKNVGVEGRTSWKVMEVHSKEIGGGMLDDSTWEQPLVIYTRAWLDRKASNLSLSNKNVRVIPMKSKTSLLCLPAI